MVIRLNVPYNEKDMAKANGAKWNPIAKTWYTDDIKLLSGLSKWIYEYNVICDNLYIFEMERICWKCKKETDVVCLGSDKSYSIECGYHTSLNILLFSYVNTMPDPLATHMKKKFRYFPSYSKIINTSYYVNHCRYCDSIQGDNYLHEVPVESFYKQLCYKNCKPTTYSKINNQYGVPLKAELPNYDDIAGSLEMLMTHMETGVENRASLEITQKLINNLFKISISHQDIEINGL